MYFMSQTRRSSEHIFGKVWVCKWYVYKTGFGPKIHARYVPIFHYVPKHTIIPAKNILNTCQKYTNICLYVGSILACTGTYFMLQICSYWYIYDQFWSIVVCIHSYLTVYPPNQVDSAGTDAHTWQAIAGAWATSLQLKRQCLLLHHWMIWWKDHCPRIDMEDQAASARLVSLVTLSILKACLLPCMHTVRDCSCLASWNQGQATQDVGDWHNPDILAGLRQIKHLGSDLSCILPPWLGFSRAIVP